MKISQESLEFGNVQTGKAGVVTLQLHNQKQVPCEWSVKMPIEASKAKDWAYFVLEPPEGVLEPDQKLNVRVIFTPVLGREAIYQQVCVECRSPWCRGEERNAILIDRWVTVYESCGVWNPKSALKCGPKVGTLRPVSSI